MSRKTSPFLPHIHLPNWLWAIAIVGLEIHLASASLLVEAHRGDSSNAPENTLDSIELATDSADLTEMDIRATRDGRLVLMHDAKVNRTTDGRGTVKRKTLAEIQSLDAGSWFSDDFSNTFVPTLEQAVNASIGFGIEPLIERKSGSAEMYHDALMAMDLDESQFRIISFDRRFIRDLNNLHPDYRLGVLGGGAITQAKLDRLASNGADFISWRHGSVRSQATVDLVHASGMELHVWTVNNPNRMEQLIDLGVDGITTDYPDLLRTMLEPTGLHDPGGMATIPFNALPVSAIATSAVPEPSSMLWSCAGALAWMLRRYPRTTNSKQSGLPLSSLRLDSPEGE